MRVRIVVSVALVAVACVQVPLWAQWYMTCKDCTQDYYGHAICIQSEQGPGGNDCEAYTTCDNSTPRNCWEVCRIGDWCYLV